MAREADKSFPHHQAFSRLGSLEQRIELVREHASSDSQFADILPLLPTPVAPASISGDTTNDALHNGTVYMALMSDGRERRYKIGKAILVERRRDQISIQLPERLTLVHAINTDDAFGIEKYWHGRFSSKRTQGEWFTLSQNDIRAFKKRRFM